jgi:type IV pilus assembly protein PilV
MKPHPHISLKQRTQRGIALIEAMLAVVVLAIGLLGAIGMQARAYAGLSDASMRAEATLAAEKLFGVMSTDVANVAQYAFEDGDTPDARLAVWYAETRTAIPNAEITITVTPALSTNRTAVSISISWTRKAGGQRNTHAVTSYVTQSS